MQNSMANTNTTQTLRETLFDCIEKVRSGTMSPSDARTIATLADKIIDSAELELRYSETVSKLDREGQGITTGPLLLTNGKEQ